MVTVWRMRCSDCKTEWELRASFDLSTFKTFYHYCRTCKKNTFHEILGREEIEA
ncbi:MAG: hypothetical protein F7C07_01365 [Desulfurococcales archaeon]|nr:hypothetical protein [Desulfurococcales archaeon]